MHDPMKWALPLYRAFGIQVRVHLLFFLITIPLCIRLIYLFEGLIWWFDIFMLTTGIVFLCVLLHEYGHAFAARWVGGEASEILLWPLGGLAFVEVPHTPRHNAIVTAAGPAVNLVICVVGALALLSGGYSPLNAFNPFGNAFTTPTYHMASGATYGSNYSYRHYVKAGTTEPVDVGSISRSAEGTELTVKGSPLEKVERALLPSWVIWVWRVIWINWWMFLFNMLLPAYPMDAGRLLHSFLWARSDYRSATITTCYVGYGVAVLLVVVSFLTNEAFMVGFALFIGLTCYQTLRQEMETERGAFGYDFSQGYTSLERDDPPPPRAKRKNFVRRWLDARKAKKLHREQEQKLQDDTRMDQLLEKIARSGKNSLTDEERRFMERVSARYRNK